jgi:hypothetical protein
VRKSLYLYSFTILAFVPYPIGVAWARGLAGNAWARRLFFRRDMRLIKVVYEDACGIRLDDGAVHRLLMAKSLKRWLIFKIPKLSDQELERYVRITGLDRVREFSRSGQGVVLASAHYMNGSCAGTVLARLGFDFLSLRRSKPRLRPSYNQIRYTYVGGKNAVFAFKEISRRLRSGGVIYSLFDGLQGKGTIVRPFLGRNCHFRRALVELAWSEGAAIVPVSVRTDLDGRILIDFGQPLTTEIAEMPAKEAAAGIIERYAAYLGTAIRTYPWCFDPARLDLFMRRTSDDGPYNAPTAATP